MEKRTLSVVLVMCIVAVGVHHSYGCGGGGGGGGPTANLEVDPSCAVGNEEVLLDGSGSRANYGSIRRCSWDFDGDGTWDYTETPTSYPDGQWDKMTTHSYSCSTGVYTAKLGVWNNYSGDSDTAEVTVNMTSVLNVPSEYDTIQDAIDAALCGDVVVVAEGIYYENIDFNGKLIRVIGAADVTVIDGCGGDVVTFSGGKREAQLINFTIRGGYSGVVVANSSALIDNCDIVSNSRCGLWMYDNDSQVDHEVTVSRCEFSGNGYDNGFNGTIDDAGGGILNGDIDGAPLPDYTPVWDVVVKNCIFKNNYADNGGGIYVEYYSAMKILNCLFLGNEAGWIGGGVFDIGCNITILNSTFVGNEACKEWEDPETGDEKSDAIAQISGPPDSSVRNCIIMDDVMVDINLGAVDYDYCHLYNGPEGVYPMQKGTYPYPGSYLHYTRDEAEFVDAGSGDYSLASNSVCIDSGDPDTTTEEVGIKDIAGQTRIVNDVVDRGAYEYQGE